MKVSHSPGFFKNRVKTIEKASKIAEKKSQKGAKKQGHAPFCEKYSVLALFKL